MVEVHFVFSTAWFKISFGANSQSSLLPVSRAALSPNLRGNDNNFQLHPKVTFHASDECTRSHFLLQLPLPASQIRNQSGRLGTICQGPNSLSPPLRAAAALPPALQKTPPN